MCCLSKSHAKKFQRTCFCLGVSLRQNRSDTSVRNIRQNGSDTSLILSFDNAVRTPHNFATLLWSPSCRIGGEYRTMHGRQCQSSRFADWSFSPCWHTKFQSELFQNTHALQEVMRNTFYKWSKTGSEHLQSRTRILVAGTLLVVVASQVTIIILAQTFMWWDPWILFLCRFYM